MSNTLRGNHAEQREPFDSVAGIIMSQGGQVLLFQKDGLAPTDRLKYMFPAGGREPGESAWEAFLREAKEEITYAPQHATLLGSRLQASGARKWYYWAIVSPAEAKLFKLNHSGRPETWEGQSVDFYAIDAVQQWASDALTKGTYALLRQFGHVLQQHALAGTPPAAAELGLDAPEAAPGNLGCAS